MWSVARAALKSERSLDQNVSGHRPDPGTHRQNDCRPKGDERWEIARDENTKSKGQLKVGQKVTIHYRMTATSVETKAGTEPKGTDK